MNPRHHIIGKLTGMGEKTRFLKRLRVKSWFHSPDKEIVCMHSLLCSEESLTNPAICGNFTRHDLGELHRRLALKQPVSGKLLQLVLMKTKMRWNPCDY